MYSDIYCRASPFSFCLLFLFRAAFRDRHSLYTFFVLRYGAGVRSKATSCKVADIFDLLVYKVLFPTFSLRALKPALSAMNLSEWRDGS